MQPPPGSGGRNDIFVMAADACFECAQACRACAEACLGEQELGQLRNCAEMNLDCADVCFAAGDLAIRRVLLNRNLDIQGTGFDERIMELMFGTCAEACRLCGYECLHYVQHHKCFPECAYICRCCAQACLKALRATKRH